MEVALSTRCGYRGVVQRGLQAQVARVNVRMDFVNQPLRHL